MCTDRIFQCRNWRKRSPSILLIVAVILLIRRIKSEDATTEPPASNGWIPADQGTGTSNGFIPREDGVTDDTDDPADDGGDAADTPAGNNGWIPANQGEDTTGGWVIPVAPEAPNCGYFNSRFVSARTMVPADSFCESNGIVVQEFDDTTQNIGFIDFDDTMSYDITLDHGEGYYSVEFRIASPGGDGGLELRDYVTGDVYLQMENFPATGDWDVYTTIESEAVLPSGSRTYTVRASEQGWNFMWMRITPEFRQDLNPEDEVIPEIEEDDMTEDTDDTAADEAETDENCGAWCNTGNGIVWGSDPDSDPQGGENWDAPTEQDVGNVGAGSNGVNGFFRVFERVNAPEFFDTTGDIRLEDSWEGGENLSFIVRGDVLKMLLDIPAAGRYRLLARVAGFGDGGFFVFGRPQNEAHLEQYAEVDRVPNTGWWQTWETFTVGFVDLVEGIHYMEMIVTEGGWNLRWFAAELVRSAELVVPEDFDTIGSVLLQAADFDDSDGIQLEGGNLGRAQTVAYIDEGDFLDYTVNIPESGEYRMNLRVASPDGGGSFAVLDPDSLAIYLEVDDVPATGDWNVWNSFAAADISLPAGEFSFQILAYAGGWNLQWFTFEYLGPPSGGLEANEFIVPASDFVAAQDIQIEGDGSPRSQNLAGIDGQDFIAYDVDFPRSGTYQVDMRIGSPEGTTRDYPLSFINRNSQEIYLEVDSLPGTGWWDIWETVNVGEAYFDGGLVPLELRVYEGGWNLLQLSFTYLGGGGRGTSNFLVNGADFDDQMDVQAEGQIPRTQNVAFIDNGDWTGYSVDISTGGTYRVDLRVGSQDGVAQDIAILATNRDTRQVLAELGEIPATGWGFNWEKVSLGEISFPSGNYPLELVFLSGGFNLLDLTFEYVGGRSSNPLKFYIAGGSYVDAIGVQAEGASERTQSVGFIDAGDWIEYDITVPSSGVYQLDVRIASPGGEGSFMVIDPNTFQVYAERRTVPNTGDFNSWQTITVGNIPLVGREISSIRVLATAGGWNMFYLTVEYQNSLRGNNRGDPNVPWWLLPENDDYYTETGSPLEFLYLASDLLVSEGVIVEQSSEGQFENVAWVDDDDWFAYDIRLPSSGLYEIDMRIGSIEAGGSVEFVNYMSQEIYGRIDNMPNTEWWQNWQTVGGSLTLPGGRITLQLRAVNGGWNLLWFKLRESFR